MPCKQSFHFKKFSICQDKAAMKVGTDGVLLGAWADHPKPEYILDIGTGTGLIALMMGQKFNKASIHAIEIDEGAYLTAVHNINHSPWKNRIKVYHQKMEDFRPWVKYDLIVCNPPFFNENAKAKSLPRQWARHNIKMKLEDLFLFIQQFLTDSGKASLIYPKNKENIFFEQAKEKKLFPKEIVNIKGTKSAETKRILVSLIKQPVKPIVKELIIEKSRHNYTDEYKKIVKDFYLKM